MLLLLLLRCYSRQPNGIFTLLRYADVRSSGCRSEVRTGCTLLVDFRSCAGVTVTSAHLLRYGCPSVRVGAGASSLVSTHLRLMRVKFGKVRYSSPERPFLPHVDTRVPLSVEANTWRQQWGNEPARELAIGRNGPSTSVDSHTQDQGSELNGAKAEKQEGKINIQTNSARLTKSSTTG